MPGQAARIFRRNPAAGDDLDVIHCANSKRESITNFNSAAQEELYPHILKYLVDFV
jgi:hypothetical protein